MPRTLKQILYGSFFLIILGTILASSYFVFFRTSPSCFDNKQNGKETGVDCGASCIPCELKNLKLVNEVPQVFPAGNLTTFVIKVSNPSLNYGTREFDYSLEIIGNLGASLRSLNKKSSLGPNETKYLVIAGVDVNSKDVSAAKFNVSNYNWEEAKALPVYDFKFDKVITDTTGPNPSISGEVTNNSRANLPTVKVYVLLRDKSGNLLNASETELDMVSAFSTRQFKVFFPKFDSLKRVDETKTQVSAEPLND